MREKLKELIEGFPRDWKRRWAATRGPGHACGEVGLFRKAVESYDKVRRLERATFSVKAIEQSANLRCRWAVAVWRRSQQLASNHDRDTLRDATDEIDKAIDEVFCEAIKDIELLLQIGETKERFSLLGSAYKRQAFVTTCCRSRRCFEGHEASVQKGASLGTEA